MICKLGGYPIVRHNHVRDYLARLLSSVSSDTITEPSLQPVPPATALPTSASLDRDAWLDIKSRGFWLVLSEAFFDARVFYDFYPNAQTYRSRPLPTVFSRHERQKTSAYGERVRQIERGSFTPLVMTSSGGLAPEASSFLKALASKLAAKLGEPYAILMAKVRTDLAFCLLRDSVLMLKGSRQKFSLPPSLRPGLDLAVSDVRIHR